MKTFRSIQCLVILLTIAMSSMAKAENTVIVLSWDGVRYDYPDRGEFPALERMASEGMRGRLTTVYPSKTFPTHVSMATGTHPDTHGIVANRFFDRKTESMFQYANDGDWIDAEPIWITAQRQGVDAATYHWVASYSDWQGQAHRYRKGPFNPLVTDETKVDQILAWLDFPVQERPGLIMAYWNGTDSVGHRSGPESALVAEQLATQDVELMRILNKLDELQRWDSTTLIVVSDHGMAQVTENVDVEAALDQAGIEAMVTGGPVAFVYLDQATDLPRALAAVKKLANIEVYTREDLPQSFRMAHPTRIGDLIITTSPPFTVGEPGGKFSDGPFGTHGYHPSEDDMKAIIFAMGRNVKTGLVPKEIRQIDLAPTIANLLGIKAPLHAEGKVMEWANSN